METNHALPGLRPLKRHIAIRAQEDWRFLPPEIRGRITLSEIAQLLTDDGIVPDSDQATWLVVRAFERRELADGEARLVHDAREEIFTPEDFIPAKKQRREGSPDYIRGGGGEFTWDSAANLRQNLLDFLDIPLDAGERWYVRLGWPWNGPRVIPPATEPPTLSSDPPEPVVGEGRGTRRSHKQGRRAEVRQAACDLLLGMLRRGEVTPEQLDDEKKTVLHTLHGLQGSPNTVWAAKHDALEAYRAEQQGGRLIIADI